MLAILLVMVLWTFPVEAATHYVRDGGTCVASCTDWTNAFDQLTSAETAAARGDTIYVADGTYTAVTFNTATSGTTLITIKKATIADHGTSTGWSDTYGDGQAVFGAFTITTAYWLFDGQVGGGPGSWKTGFGFKISHSAATPLIDINVTTGDQVTFRHIELEGTSNSSGGGGIAQDAINMQGSDGFTISYFYMHAIGRSPFFLSPGDGFLAEYGYIGDYVSTPSAHAEAASIWANAGAFPTATTTFRYNVFGFITGTGGIMWDNSSNHSARLDVYGNVFWVDSAYPSFDNSANGVIGGWTGGGGEDFYNAHVYNNTFINITGPGEVLGTLPARSGSNEARNNLFYTVTDPGGSGSVWGTITHNHFISTSTVGTSTSTSVGNPFTNYTGLDFSLTAGTTAGTTLGSPYDVDMLVHTRGGDGTWDRGAVEFAPVVGSSHALTGALSLSGKVVLQ